MNSKQSNLAILQLVASKLEDLREEVVFVGGCVVGLLITDSKVPDVRTTLDVDCIVDVSTKANYYKIANKLRNLGFVEDKDLICRWRYDEMMLDVMPTNNDILGFSNR